MDVKDLVKKKGFEEPKKPSSRRVINVEDSKRLSLGSKGRLTIPSAVYTSAGIKGSKYYTTLFRKKDFTLAIVFYKEAPSDYDCRKLSFYSSKKGVTSTAYAEIEFLLREVLNIPKGDVPALIPMSVPFEMEDNVLYLKLKEYKGKHKPSR